METIIQACNWGASTYLIFSENVFATLIYYSHFLTISISLFVGFFVFVKGKKEQKWVI